MSAVTGSAAAARALGDDAATVVSVLDSAACNRGLFGRMVFPAAFNVGVFPVAVDVEVFAAAFDVGGFPAAFGAAAFAAGVLGTAVFRVVFAPALFDAGSARAASVAGISAAVADFAAFDTRAFGAASAAVFVGSAFVAAGARGVAGFRAGRFTWGADAVGITASGSPRSGPRGSELGGTEVTPLTYQVPSDIVGSGSVTGLG
ncbi:MAG TPA: hypothetical protein VEX88_08040 [Glaciibacter sp.]|nr:hypothetical protein [Glaciibacter sp.]